MTTAQRPKKSAATLAGVNSADAQGCETLVNDSVNHKPDTSHRKPPALTKLEAALLYASWGWHVLPVLPNAKAPATQHGVKDATTDPEQIARWWAQNPDYNIGIAAGERSGLVVFDVDPRNGGTDSWSQWVEANGAAPDGAMQLTAGGGQHYIAEYNPGLRSCKLVDGVDLLADGRYFLAFPSTIEGRRYEWEASSDPFDGVAPFPVPEQWLSAYRALRKPAERQTALTGGGLIQGSRNNGLTAMAGSLRRHGFTEAEMLAALRVANETRCDVPLPSSEVEQIARSVARYEPAEDTAASYALGCEAAEAILATFKRKATPWLTVSDELEKQPAPVPWLIRNWIPAGAFVLCHGPSGCGKTFVVLDWCLRMAAGMDEWHGHAVKPGAVIYLAGEGHHGLKGRIAAWRHHHQVKEPFALWVSKGACDLDAPQGLAMAAREIRATGTVPKLIVVDTLHRFLAGDENKPGDAKAMVDACNNLMNEFRCSVILVHHTGLAEGAQNRARGSSAWRAASDIEINIAPAKDGAIQIAQLKAKDSELAQPVYVELKQVTIPGWVDEDGEPVTSAVLEPVEAPVAAQKDTKLGEHRKMFENAWWASGAEERNGAPYVSRSALLDYLRTHWGYTEKTAQIYVRPSSKGKLIHDLLVAEIIAAFEHGWIVSDDTQASSMLIRKNA